MKKASVKKKTKSKFSKKTKASASTLNRRVLFRPDRYQYVRKLVAYEGCVFCEALKAGVSFESLCVYKSQSSMVILNKFPYNSGHLLVLPQAHKGSLLDLTQEEFDDLNATMRLAMRAVQSVYRPLGINLGLNQGKAAGAGIPDHLHYHLIPRWEGDLNFFPLIAETKVVIETLDQTYARLQSYFKENAP